MKQEDNEKEERLFKAKSISHFEEYSRYSQYVEVLNKPRKGERRTNEAKQRGFMESDSFFLH